jgi:hypothetical protein
LPARHPTPFSPPPKKYIEKFNYKKLRYLCRRELSRQMKFKIIEGEKTVKNLTPKVQLANSFGRSKKSSWEMSNNVENVSGENYNIRAAWVIRNRREYSLIA